MKNKNNDWELSDEIIATKDPLLSCLLFLSKHYEQPVSAAMLTERLPLVDNKLTPKLFLRAADRANLAAEINAIKLEEIDTILLPAVLLLDEGEAALLLEKNEDHCKIMLGKTGEGEITISHEELLSRYTGYAIFVRPKFKPKDRFHDNSTKKTTHQHWFWSVVSKSWPIYSEVLAASVLINIFALAVPLFVMNVYDRVVPNQATETMWVLASGIAIVFLFDLFLKSLRGYFIDIASKKTDVQLSSIIFEQILGIQMGSRPPSVGAFANTVQSFEAFRDFITSTTITVLVDLPFIVIYLAVIFYIGGNLVFVPLAVIPLVFVFGLLMQFPLRRFTQLTQQLSQEKNATLVESLSGIEAIKSTSAEGTMQGRFEKVVIYASKLSAKLRFLVNSSINFTTLMQQLATVGVVLVGVYKIIDGDLTVGGLIACTILSGRALAPMGQVAAIFSKYYQAVQALHSINEVMDLPTDVEKKTSYLHRPNVQGNIEFRDVEFRYPDQSIPNLNGISFKIKAGERVGLIGRTGSGKSTIAKMILGLYRPNEGTINFDGTDYLQINPADLRKQVGYVPQDVVLFYGSVKDNIILGSKYVTDEKILNASEASGVTNFTDNHPEGFDRGVGERGSRLSAGQRQSVAIARAIINSPKILILDEPSSSMDDGLERQLRKNLTKKLDKETTFILITHKAAMLELVDRLIVVDNGKIVADGPKESVLTALKSGIKFGKK